jgi:hypothetical protein
LLHHIGQRRLLRRQLGQGLLQALLVDAVVEAHQQVAGLDELEVLHRHLEHITAELRPDDRHLAAHQGVLGAFDGAAERRQLPGIEHDQYPGDGDRGEPQGRDDPHPQRTRLGDRHRRRSAAFRGRGNGVGGGDGRFGHEEMAPLGWTGVGAGVAGATALVVLISHRLRMKIQIMVSTAITAISMNTSL